MGAASSQKNSELYSVLKPINWQKQHYLGQGQLVRDIQSGLKGELYSIYLNNIQSQIPIYQFRKDNPHYIVTVHSVEQSNQQFLCTTSESVRVVTQRIPFRLGDLGNVGYAQGLYILQCALKGAQLINNRYLFSYSAKNIDESARYVQYTLNSICFTQIGEAKIWVNEDIAYNCPPPSQNALNSSNSKNILQALNIEKKTAQQIMTLIEERMSGNKFNSYLQVKKQQFQQLIDFENCIDFVLRMRAIEEGQSQATRNIILPSMLMKSMPSNNNFNKSHYEERQTGIIQAKPAAQPTYNYNILSDRLKSQKIQQNPMQRMENTVTSTSSVSGADIDINKFAVPPRPPRKSRSRSKQRPISRNSSQEKQKPNVVINLPNSIQKPYQNVSNSYQFNKSGPAPVISYTNTYYQPNTIQNPQLISQHSGQMNPTGQTIVNPGIQPTKNPFPHAPSYSGLNGYAGLPIITNLNGPGPVQNSLNNGVTGESNMYKKIDGSIQNNDKPRSPFKQITIQSDKKYTNAGMLPQQNHQLAQSIGNYVETNSTPISSPKFVKKPSTHVVNFTNTNPNATMSSNNVIHSNTLSPFGKIVQPFSAGTAKPIVTFNTVSKPDNLGNTGFQGNANSSRNGIGQQNGKRYTSINTIQRQTGTQLKKKSSQTDNRNHIGNNNGSQKIVAKASPAEMLSNYNNRYGITNTNTNANSANTNTLNTLNPNVSYLENANTNKLSAPIYSLNTGAYSYPNTITFNNNKMSFSPTPVYSYTTSNSISTTPTNMEPINNNRYNNAFSVSSNPNYPHTNSIPVLPMHYAHIPSNQFKIIEQKINLALKTSQISQNNIIAPPNSATKLYPSNNANTPLNSSSDQVSNPRNPIPINKPIQLKQSQASQFSIEGSIEQI